MQKNLSLICRKQEKALLRFAFVEDTEVLKAKCKKKKESQIQLDLSIVM